MFENFSLKKLVICIICSVILSTSIAYTICFVRNVYESSLKEVIMDVELNSVSQEEMINNAEDYHAAIDNTIDGISKRYGSEYPSTEVVYSYLMLQSFDISFYLSSLLIGIVAGMLIYIVFIERPVPLYALIEVSLCFLLSIVLVKCFDLIYTAYVSGIVDNISVLNSNYIVQMTTMSVYDLIWAFVITFLVICIIYGIKIVFTHEEEAPKKKTKTTKKKTKRA